MPERKPRLEGKVAIITGAGSRGPGIGNGKAASVVFAREGAKVLLVDVNNDHMKETLEMIKSEGGTASSVAGDVTNIKDCEMIVKTAVSRYGKLDILHNNVGIDSTGNVVTIEVAEWDRVMNINLKSVMLMSKFAIPAMKEHGGGAISNVASIAALRPRNMDAYSTSKGGVISLTMAMAASHAPDHIRVNCIIPGMVWTPMVAEISNEEMRKQRMLSTPLQTEGTAWDTALAALYLDSDEARWVTGIALPVDGGALLTRRSF
jgi:NAD(P)-dependent dehydrogenase (short-subunit alcohol dehydrogenase family)